MRLPARLFVFVALAFASCSGDGGDGDVVEDLGVFDGKADAIATRTLSVAAGASKSFRVKANDFQVVIVQEGTVEAQISAKAKTLELWSDVSTNPTVSVDVDDETVRTWTLRVYNHGESTLTGQLRVLPLAAPQPTNGLPTLADAVVYQNDWCSYADQPPYVASVNWSHPQVQAALRALGPGWRSTFTYGEWSVAYGLENASSGTDEQKMQKAARNFIRVLCGEHRDYPAMIGRKLDLIATSQVYAGPGQMESVDTTKNLFSQITYPAYQKMVSTMRSIHSYRQSLVGDPNDGFHYGFGEPGHGSNRVEHGVPPWTHCEMKFMFERYMTSNAPQWIDAAAYVQEYEEYKTGCSEDDLSTMYNFRGHKVYQPLWLESNAFIWNSRRARGAEISRGDRGYYLHPFATRYARARGAWAAYLLYRDEDHGQMIRASEWGGGPIMYLTDQDTDNNGVADYRLFGQDGCGDEGVQSPDPDSNCNMVSWETASAAPNTTGAAAAWDKTWLGLPDMGFMQTFTTFESRMARLNQALDRHTNWGPTGYYMLDASDPSDTSPRFIGAYSPIVACSYDISASNGFATGNYPSTPVFEQGRTKWMFVMRFRTADYYSEQAMRDGRPIDFDRNYFNETSLSNDYYSERALDRFGWVPLEDMHANIYFVYGARGENPPAPVDIPAP